MATASRDQNNVPTLLAALSTDGTTPIKVKVTASNHGLKVVDDVTGSDYGVRNAPRDSNFVPVLVGVSSATTTVNGISYVQGVTPVTAYADSNGNLLVKST